MVAIQLREGRYISQAQVRSWASITSPQLAAQFGWSDQYHALQRESDTRRTPQRLLARATAGYLANVISLRAIARLRGITPHEVETEFAEAGLIPRQANIEWASPDDLTRIDELSATIEELSARIETEMRPFAPQIERLVTIPGVK